MLVLVGVDFLLGMLVLEGGGGVPLTSASGRWKGPQRLRLGAGCSQGGLGVLSAVHSAQEGILATKMGVRIWGSEPDPLIPFLGFGGPSQTPYSPF